MRLISFVYLLGLAAVMLILVLPVREFAGAKGWLIGQYNMHLSSSGDLQQTIALVVAMLVLVTVTLFAVIRALDF
jgi:hypothetical protein